MPLIPWTTPAPDRVPRHSTPPAPGAAGPTGWSRASTGCSAEYDLDGLYFDGTSEAWRCQNQAHGCGWKDARGKLHTEYPLLAARQMMRRIADAVHRHRPDAILDVHMSASLTLPTLAFCDSLLERRAVRDIYKASDKFELPLHAFRTEFMGYAHGLDAEFLCYENRPFTLDEAIALAWLHGVEVRPYPGHPAANQPDLARHGQLRDVLRPVAALLERLRRSRSGRVGQSQRLLEPRESPALRQPSQTRAAQQQPSTRPPPAGPGLRDRSRAIDAITGAAVALEGDTLPLSFDGMTYRLIEIQDKHFKLAGQSRTLQIY